MVLHVVGSLPTFGRTTAFTETGTRGRLVIILFKSTLESHDYALHGSVPLRIPLQGVPQRGPSVVLPLRSLKLS